MTRAFPYRTPAPDVVRASAWARAVDNGTIPLGESLDDWDYNTVLDLARTVEVDARCIRRTVGLPPAAGLSLSVRWTASGSLLRGSAFRIELADADSIAVPAVCRLPGADLGGVLLLDTCVSLSTRVTAGVAQRTPTRAGSVLWRDTHEVRLQGAAPLFPIATADFGELAHPTDAAWFLEVGSDFDAAAMGAILLLVNERCGEVLRALSVAGDPDPTARAVLSVLRAGVATGLVEHALVADEFALDAEYERGSLGEAIVGLLWLLGLNDVASLRLEREREPALFAARMQAATRLWAAT